MHHAALFESHLWPLWSELAAVIAKVELFLAEACRSEAALDAFRPALWTPHFIH